ncbi:PAS domain S-box protein [Candidatus Villigracilis affinis]|uniref:PAS domain-containing protein n=1 Tax=Candidatus Villigracilis affinis TaxID=3140682 RepID=UPI002A1A71D6|nr:PAS domain S-box protein [Anaerolineales bacterium]
MIILNRAINQSSDAVFLINEQLTFAYVNDAACRSLGYTREELLTMGPSDIDAVITYGGAKDIMDKQFSNDSYPIFETRHKMRDGRTFPVEIGSSVVEYDGAKFSLTTVRDISERKRAEDALLEREKHSQSLLRLSRKLEQAQTYTEVMNSARDEAQAVIGYQNLWAYLFTPDKKQAKVLLAKGPVSENVMSEDGVATLTVQGDRMMEEIVETRRSLLLKMRGPMSELIRRSWKKMGNRTLVNIPIMLFDRHMGSVGGYIWG